MLCSDFRMGKGQYSVMVFQSREQFLDGFGAKDCCIPILLELLKQIVPDSCNGKIQDCILGGEKKGGDVQYHRLFSPPRLSVEHLL